MDKAAHTERSGELFKLATSRELAEDWDGAIGALREAIVHRELGEFPSGHKTDLRLAQYLHAAGRSKEAWKEFNRLLFKLARAQDYQPAASPMLLAELFDKMRLYLEREGKADAPLFGTFADVCWRVGLQRQERFEELSRADGEMTDPDTTCDELAIGEVEFDWRAFVLSQMGAYHGTGTIKALCAAIADGFRVGGKLDYDVIGKGIERVLREEPATQ
jgi:hypothetical protein